MVRVRLLVLMGLFLAGAWMQGRALPVLEGGDEWLQLAYVEHLRTTGTLPPRADYQTSPVRQQSGQPPLTYAVFSLALLGEPTFDTTWIFDQLQVDSNNWFTPPDRFNRLDNNNVFYLSNAPANDPAIANAVRRARWLAPLFGIVAILAAYAAAWEVFQDARWALAVTGAFAFTPTMIHVNSFITTDGGATALAAVVTWLALRISRRGLDLRLTAWTGLAVGLAGLAKVNTLLLGPGVALAVILAAWSGPHRWRTIFQHGLLMLLVFIVTFGPWVAFGMLTFDDPFGTRTHDLPGHTYDPPLDVADVLARTPEVWLSYVGKFASAVYLHPASYAVLGALGLLALLGYVFAGWPRLSPQALVLAAFILCVGAGLWRWIATVQFITGRLLFPAHLALSIAFVAGLRRLPYSGVLLRGLAIVPAAVVGLVVSPMVIGAAYTPHLLTQATFSGPLVDFEGTIRFLGHQKESTVIQQGTLHRLKLCWEVLAEPERPAAYSLKIVRDGVPVGERTTVHDLGRYDSDQWRVGDRWCERLEVPIAEPPEPGVAYDLLLVLLDARTGAVDWNATTTDGQPVAFPVIGQVTGVQP